MTRKTRRTLFYICIALFLLISPVVALLALGYKFDFTRYQFVKTGSFRVISNVAAQVVVNGVPAGETSFLLNSFSERGLLPRTYSVRLERAGYQTWQKNIVVSGGYFTDFPKVTLIPSTFTETIVATSSLSPISNIHFDNDHALVVLTAQLMIKGKPVIKSETISLRTGLPTIAPTPTPLPSQPTDIDRAVQELHRSNSSVPLHGYIISPDETKIIWATDHEIWVAWLENASHQPFYKAGDVQLVTHLLGHIGSVAWYGDSEHLLAADGSLLKFIEIDTRGGMNTMHSIPLSGPFLYSRELGAIFTIRGNHIVKIIF